VTSPAAPLDARLLVIDDETVNLDLMRRVLVRAGYQQITCCSDPTEALARFDEVAPDLVLLDLHMPVLDGFAVLEQLAARIPPDEFLPRLVITADSTGQTRRRALASGAHDFLTKPIDVAETTLRVANLLHTRALHHSLRQHNSRLEQAVRERTAELAQAQHEVAVRWAGSRSSATTTPPSTPTGWGCPRPASPAPSACRRTRST
jgi:PleD family two-component response regulator